MRWTMGNGTTKRTPVGRLVLLAFATVAAAVVAAGVPGTAESAFPGLNGKIAYVDSTGYIRVMNPDGSGSQQLRPGTEPAWSPDGQKIAYSWNTGIYVMNADGSNAQLLADHTDGLSGPTWSADGQKLAFERTNGPIYAVNVDGSNQIQLTTWAHQDPAWSPDGQTIAFSNGFGLRLMDADGSNYRELTDPYWPGDVEPAWSPDGQKVAYASSFDGSWQIYVVTAGGMYAGRITNTNDGNRNPAWSPDGARVAFSCGANICAADANGSSSTVLATGGSDPDWQPVDTLPTRVATVQRPLNADGSSVFKAGRGALPVKFALAVDGTPTCTLPPATIAFSRLSGAISGQVNESEYGLSSDSGSDFRVDDCQYVYNLGLRSVSAGTYRVEIKIDGQTVGSVGFELR